MKIRKPHIRSDMKKLADVKEQKTVMEKDTDIPATINNLIAQALEDLSDGMTRSDRETSTHSVKAYRVGGNLIRIDILSKKGDN